MKFAIYVVTYRNDDLLFRCLDSIFGDSGLDSNCDSLTVTVINNYDKLKLDPRFEGKVEVLDNLCRPDFSTGHLGRSWNQCILNGIKDINKPDCDVLILSQGDAVFLPQFITKIKKLLPIYNYITFGRGDEVQIMTPASIKQIGLYDERFCNIGYQEGDYLLRALILNKDKSSINDTDHRRVHNLIEEKIIDLGVQNGSVRGDVHHVSSSQNHFVSRNFFFEKWKDIIPNIKSRWDPSRDWSPDLKEIKVAPKQYIFYPYFELKLPDLDQKYLNTLK